MSRHAIHRLHRALSQWVLSWAIRCFYLFLRIAIRKLCYNLICFPSKKKNISCQERFRWSVVPFSWCTNKLTSGKSDSFKWIDSFEQFVQVKRFIALAFYGFDSPVFLSSFFFFFKHQVPCSSKPLFMYVVLLSWKLLIQDRPCILNRLGHGSEG